MVGPNWLEACLVPPIAVLHLWVGGGIQEAGKDDLLLLVICSKPLIPCLFILGKKVVAQSGKHQMNAVQQSRRNI